METIQPVLDFFRLSAAVAVGVFVAEASLAAFMIFRGVRARRKKLAKLRKFEEEFVKKGKVTDQNLAEAADVILKGLGG